MTASKLTTHLSDARGEHNTSWEALMTASAALVASAAPATSAYSAPDDQNGGCTSGPEVESCFPSDDPNELLAPTRGETKNYEPNQQKMQPLPEPARGTREVVDKRNPGARGDYHQSPEDVAAAGGSAVVAAQRAPVRQDPSPVPKWIRVGERVCFSTVVSAVLIPSAEDISATAKRELWWQPEDFFEFRMNHARRQAAGKSVDDDDEDHPRVTPVATATVNSAAAALDADSGPEDTAATALAVNAHNDQSICKETATVEGVLLVAASPAPAPAAIASRSASRTAADVGASGNSGDPRISGLNKRSTGAMTAADKERAGKWTTRERDGRPDQLQHTPRRATGNLGGGASGGPNQSGQKRRGRGNRSPSVRNPVGRQSRRPNGGDQSLSYRNDFVRRSHGSGQVYGDRNWSAASGSNDYAPPNHGRPFAHDIAAGHGTTEPFVVGQYPRQLPVRGATGSMLPPPAHPGMIMVRPQDAKPQFSMWRSPVFAPIILQCVRENMVA